MKSFSPAALLPARDGTTEEAPPILWRASQRPRDVFFLGERGCVSAGERGM